MSSRSRRSAASRAVAPGDDLAALLIAALEGSAIAPRARDILVVTSKIVSKAEGRYLDLAIARARRAGARARPDHGQGRAPRRGDPVGGDRGRARQAQRADRRHPPRLRDGQRRHRPVQPRRRGPWPPRAAAAAGARRQRAGPQGAARRALRRRDRRHPLRQRRPGLAARHGRSRHRRGRRALAVGPARREGPVGPAAGGHRGRLSPMRLLPPPCSPWARPRRAAPPRWCAGSTGARRRAPAAALVRPRAEDLFR